MREVCGTVSGALLVLGQVCGYSDSKDAKAKTEHYHLVQEFARRFKEINGTIICRELLQGVRTKPGNDPEARTAEYYASRPCLRHVGEAADIAGMARLGVFQRFWEICTPQRAVFGENRRQSRAVWAFSKHFCKPVPLFE